MGWWLLVSGFAAWPRYRLGKWNAASSARRSILPRAVAYRERPTSEYPRFVASGSVPAVRCGAARGATRPHLVIEGNTLKGTTGAGNPAALSN